MAGCRSRRLAAAFLFMASVWPGLVPASPTASPTPAPVLVTQARRFLLRMDLDKKLAANAVVDALVRKQGERTLAWNLSVTYYLPDQLAAKGKVKGKASAKAKPGAILSRQYGSSVMNKVDGRNIRIDLVPEAIVLDLPTLGGDHLIPVSGTRDSVGAWALQGRAEFPTAPTKKLKHPKPQVWTVHSIPKFKHGTEELKAVP